MRVEGRIVAIDGKTLRRSHHRSQDVGPIHVVNAWCTDIGLALAQVKTDAKSNEIEAIPRLLDLLVLKGAIVTLDAMGCQKGVADKIREQQSDYMLAVKGNHPKLLAGIQARFDEVLAKEVPIKALQMACTGSRCRLPRGREPHSHRTRRGEHGEATTNGPKSTQAREDGQGRHQEQASESGLG